ncbi:MAG: class I SAM-dependent methyltransferase [Sphingomicrobium sp.]
MASPRSPRLPDIGGFLSSFFRIARSLTSATGRSVVWTRLRHGRALHQTATTTAPDRYPDLFAALVCLLPPDADILSFGCSTGEELLTLRRLMPMAHIVGVEINPRARRIATRATAGDPRITVAAALPDGQFDAVLALAVLQREPIRIARDAVRDLRHHYPFARFDAVLTTLVDRLRPGGVLAVLHAHYRVEDGRVAGQLEALVAGPRLSEPLFDRSSRRYDPAPPSASLFRKCAAIASASPNS